MIGIVIVLIMLIVIIGVVNILAVLPFSEMGNGGWGLILKWGGGGLNPSANYAVIM